MERRAAQTVLTLLAQVVLLGVVNFAIGRLSVVLAVSEGVATPIFPPAGIALAALLLYGQRLAPGVFLGALLLNLQLAGGGAIRAEAVARAPTVDHPAPVASFVTAVFVRPGDAVQVGTPLVDLSSHFIDRELEIYRGQLELYGRIVQRLDPTPIRLGLYFPLVQGWREWAPMT